MEVLGLGKELLDSPGGLDGGDLESTHRAGICGNHFSQLGGKEKSCGFHKTWICHVELGVGKDVKILQAQAQTQSHQPNPSVLSVYYGFEDLPVPSFQAQT